MKTQSVLKTKIGSFNITANCENGVVLNVKKDIGGIIIETINNFSITSINLAYIIVILSFLDSSENIHWKDEIKELCDFCQEIDKELTEIRGY